MASPPLGQMQKKDNIFQNLPQVNLHGMDEGLTLKMCTNILRATVEEAQSLNRKMNTTSVSESSMLNAVAYLYSYH
jgi:hypothetical protein